MEPGIVIKSTGSRYRVLTPDDRLFECTLKGKFRVQSVRTTNPVAVGDKVMFIREPHPGSGVITEVLDRHNYILRKASNLSKQAQIIAANIDQAFLMVTIIHPETPVEFIDRFLLTCEAYRIPARVIINKTDIYGEEEYSRMDRLSSLYGSAGYECISISVADGSNLGRIRELMTGKVTLVAGNSGVGKSSLLNFLNPSLGLRTEEISDYHKQGKHITTFPEMHKLPFGGFAIDTPGIRGFGLTDMDKNEIYHFFPELFSAARECRYYNCLHVNEPGCAVRKAVEEGLIDSLRYRSYLSIMEDDDSKYR